MSSKTAPPVPPASQAEIEQALLSALADIAPEADLAGLDPKADLRAALDIDSFDFLNFMLGLNKRLGVDVPETDYPLVRTLEGCRRYLRDRLPGGHSGAFG